MTSKICCDQAKEIYGHLQDNLSKQIFADRLLYSLTGDSTFIQNVVRQNIEGVRFLEKLDTIRSSGGQIVLYGAGVIGQCLFQTYPKYFRCFVDKRYKEIRLQKASIYPPDWLLDHKDVYVLIAVGMSSYGATEEIRAWLQENHFASNQIFDYYSAGLDLCLKQYFDLPDLVWNGGDVFLDCGCADGFSSLNYVKIHNEKCNKEAHCKIIAFEPSKQLCEELVHTTFAQFKENVAVEVIPKAAWDQEGIVYAKSISNSGQIILTVEDSQDTPPLTVEAYQTIPIDDVVGNNKISFIKMDIEGAEYNALLGAEHTIRTDRPQLAISIYHRPEDILKLPHLILSFNPEYRLYLRHYSIEYSDTVLYAIPK